MAKVFVQFIDSTQTKIQSAFGCPQDATAYPNQGQVDDTDARYVAFITPVITLKQQAKTALDKSDITMLRCVESGITVPIEWNNYRKSLRAIANGTDTISTTLPTQPNYPAGT